MQIPLADQPAHLRARSRRGGEPQYRGKTPARRPLVRGSVITGTPTINLATNTMYVVAATKESGVTYLAAARDQHHHGAERTNSLANYGDGGGTGNGSSGGQLSFERSVENQRRL